MQPISLHHPQHHRQDHRPPGDVKEENQGPETPERNDFHPKTIR